MNIQIKSTVMNDSTEPIKQDGFRVFNDTQTSHTACLPTKNPIVSIVTWGKYARQTDDNNFIWF